MSQFRRSDRFRNFQPLFRAITVISAVAVLATGVTFAALQSTQVALTGNSVQTATAGLKIGTSTASFDTSRVGFVFKDLVPGGAAVPAAGNNFYLKNTGSATLALKAAVSTTPVNAGNVDMSKVYVVLTRVDTSSVDKIALSALTGSYGSGGVALQDSLAGSSTVAQYKYQVAMDADAFSGQEAEITGIDLVFSGTAVVQ